MQQIARELKGFVSEVGYIAQTDNHEFHLKYYSSEREVDFCGHATIGIMYDIIKNNPEFMAVEKFIINTNRGRLPVYNNIKSDDSVFIMSPEPFEINKSPDIEDIAKYLRIDPSQIDDGFEIKIINAGLSTLLVPIKNLYSILHIKPDLEDLKNFCFEWGIDIVEVFYIRCSQQ